MTDPDLRPDASDALRSLLSERILVLDGAMGTMIQRAGLAEADYRGERFADWTSDLRGNNDLLSMTAPHVISGIHREYLAAAPAPRRDEIKKLIVSTSKRHGVDPTLMLALSYQESGWNQRAVSVANAVGVMQVIPSGGQWASSLVGRRLDLLRTQDNITAGVVMLRALARATDRTEHQVAAYYQGLGALQKHGMYRDTKAYVKNVLALRKTM